MLDIIIVNYKSTTHLINCLRSIEGALDGVPAKIYVQDNASTDEIDAILPEFPRVILTRNRKNLGFGKAVNKALKQGAGEYVVILNPDTYVLEGFFESCRAFMEENPDVGVMGPRILDGDGCLQNSARSFPTPLTGLFGRSSLLSRWFPKNPITSRNLLSLQSDGRSPMPVDWVSGACMVARRKAIEEVDLLDQRFFMYWEDADWCRRMWDREWKVVYYPRPTVIHFVGVSSDQLPLRSVFEFHKSGYLLFTKYNKLASWFMKPLVIAGLFFRFCFVVTADRLRAIHGRRISKRERPRKKEAGPGEPIKVLRLIARLNIGGPAIHVHLLTKGLDRSRVRSLLVTGMISPQEGDMSYLFDGMDMKPRVIPELQREISLKLDFKATWKIFRILREERPDIVDTHTAKAGTSARIAASLYNLFHHPKIKRVHTFHGHVFSGYFSRFKSNLFIGIERSLSSLTDVIIAISETQKRELAVKYRIAPESKIKTIELGFDLKPFFNCNELRGRFRQRLGVAPDTLLIGIIGRLVPIKNHLMFLKAAKLFLAENRGVKVKFLVVGDGELREPLESFCESRGLSRHVHFSGWVRGVATVYADLDILALTSINEGTPVSIIEAMASSVPVISTDAGGVHDLLGDPRGDGSPASFIKCDRGILCRKNDVRGFSAGLSYLALNGSRGRAASEKENRLERARLFVEQRYSRERLVRDMERLYTGLIEREGARVGPNDVDSARPASMNEL